jgi:molybdopterin molybdotransferase
MGELLSVDLARKKLLGNFTRLGGELVKIDEALDRILAEDIIAPSGLPRFDNSAVDGFAVLSEDLRLASLDAPVKLPVVADIPAGKPADTVLKNGQAMRIMTGAPIPEGADAVVPVEDTNFKSRSPKVITPTTVDIYNSPKIGENIRIKGEDIKAGTHIYQQGEVLRPQDIGFIASFGTEFVKVYRRPRVAIFSSGDEIIPVGESLLPGKIFDSNGLILQALIKKHGGDCINLGIASDRFEDVKNKLDQAAERKVDLIISSAGVSVGAFDYVRHVIEAYGSLGFWRVNMRPGKPLVFGSYSDIPFIGLPGNPVSAFVGFLIFIRPAISKLAGLPEVLMESVQVKLGEDIKSDGRESYLRGHVKEINGEYVAFLTGHQGSGNLYAMVQANALIIIPSGVESLPTNSKVDAWII